VSNTALPVPVHFTTLNSREGQPLFYLPTKENYFLFAQNPNSTGTKQSVLKQQYTDVNIDMQINDVNNSPVLNILDLNCKNILTSISLFDELDKSVDIYILQEHWLFECQLHLLQELHHNYNGTGNVVDTYDPIAPYIMPRGHGGVAIMWKKTLDNFITPLTIGNERIQCNELSGNKECYTYISQSTM
jgi:hypothetical protein